MEKKKSIIRTYCTNSLFQTAYASYSREFEPAVLSSEVLKNFFLTVIKSKPFLQLPQWHRYISKPKYIQFILHKTQEFKFRLLLTVNIACLLTR